MALKMFFLYYAIGSVFIGIPMAWKSVQLCCKKEWEKWGVWGRMLFPLNSYVRENPSFSPFITRRGKILRRNGKRRLLFYFGETMLIWPLRVGYNVIWYIIVLYLHSCEVKHSTFYVDP